jgi:PHP family Zn ribbon phosphoesterase
VLQLFQTSMEYVTDLHLHSKYSRAVSQNMTLPIMAQFAQKKGLDILATGDWTHPLWVREIRNQLEEAGAGLYKLKGRKKGPLFLLSVEIASIYSHKGKLRRIHNLLFAPNFSIVDKINSALIGRGCNLSSDGRPIIGLSSKALLELVLSIDKRVILIPCHIWTPHFGMYGSASGYDSLLECFDDYTRYIYGIETGLSSDPTMNWQISELEPRSILSFSDAHSPAKMGREATVVDIDKDLDEITYMDIGRAIAGPMKAFNAMSVSHLGKGVNVGLSEEDPRIAYTLEFYPEEGKYHYSGHRNCKYVQDPKTTEKEGLAHCPVCKKRLTEGVMYRVSTLANKPFLEKETFDKNGVRWLTDPTEKKPPFVKLVPLNEIIAESVEASVQSEKVKNLFTTLCNELGSEITVLLKTSIKEIMHIAGAKIAEGVKKVRAGDIAIEPGYDGEYGKVKIWHEEEKKPAATIKSKPEEQMGLF